MKFFLRIAGATLLLISINNFDATAQSTRLGVGLIYGGDIENAGIQARADLPLSTSWRLSPAINLFFPKDFGIVDRTWATINIDANYLIPIESNVVDLYSITGLNFAFRGWDYNDGRDDREVNQTDLGVNLGLGAEFDIDSSITPYTELKYVFGDADQTVLAIGIKFNLN